jgi:hypothetical protein
MAEPLFNTAWEAAEWRKARLRKLGAVLRELVTPEPLGFTESEGEHCLHCDGFWPATEPERHEQPFPHTPNCPWAKARALLGEEG